MTLEEFTARAIRVPFMDKGRDWDCWDCWGMIFLFHREVLSVTLPSYTEDYQDAGHSVESRQRLSTLIKTNMGAWRRVERPEPGDVVLLNIGGRPIHVGLALGGGLMMHTERKINTVIERLDSPMWAKRIEGFYRYG